MNDTLEFVEIDHLRKLLAEVEKENAFLRGQLTFLTESLKIANSYKKKDPPTQTNPAFVGY